MPRPGQRRQARSSKPNPETQVRTPLSLYAPSGHQFRSSSMPFCFLKKSWPGKHPLSSFSPKILKPRKSTWVASGAGCRAVAARQGGWGWFQRTPGRVARLPFCVTNGGAPWRSRGGAVSGPQRRRFIFFPGGLRGRISSVPVLPDRRDQPGSGGSTQAAFWIPSVLASSSFRVPCPCP